MNQFTVTTGSVAADNRASVLALKIRKPGPARYLIDHLEEEVEVLRRKHHLGKTDLTFRWVPGHQDIVGNELADAAAKEAARGRSSPRQRLPSSLRQPLPLSASKLRQTYADQLKMAAQEAWRNTERGHFFNYVDPYMPSPRYMKMTKNLTRPQASLLVQLRTAHVPLNQHLYRIRRSDTSKCPHCDAKPETPLHILMSCPAYRQQRAALRRELHCGVLSVPGLLASPKSMPALFRYLRSTGRFTDTFGSLSSHSASERHNQPHQSV